MPKPATKTIEAPKQGDEESNDIGDFAPEKNSLLDDVGMTEHQLSEKMKSSKKPESEPEPVAGKKPKKDELSSEDDFVVPGDESDFDIDDPLDIDLGPDKRAKPDEKPEEKPEERVIHKKGENLNLRDAVKEANERAQQATGLAERLRGERDALKAKLEDAQNGYNDIQNRLSFRNPVEHPDVRNIVAPWDRELNIMAEEMNLSGENGTQLKTMAPTLVRMMQSLGDPSSQGYSDRKEEIIEAIGDNFPEDKKDVIKLISKGARTLEEANAKIEELKSIGSDYETNQANENYNNISKAWDDLDKTFFKPSPDLIANDPMNPKVILHNLIDIDPQVKAKSEQIRKFVRYASLPLPPVDKREVSGMDDDAAANYLQSRTRHHSVAQQRFQQMATEALLSHACLPSIYKSLMDAKEENSNIKMTTPKPGEDGKQTADDRDDGESGDVKEFSLKPTQLNFD